MTDNTVPEGHKGLHGYLYGDGGAEVHDGAERQYQSREVCTFLILFCSLSCDLHTLTESVSAPAEECTLARANRVQSRKYLY